MYVFLTKHENRACYLSIEHYRTLGESDSRESTSGTSALLLDTSTVPVDRKGKQA